MKQARMSYTATETAAAFHRSSATVRGLMGPRGCGKSVACCEEIIRRSNMQAPYHGVRESRWAVVRNTYPELKSTTLKTWTQWMPEEVAPINWGAPITCNMEYPLSDGTTVKSEVLFMSMDRPQHIRKLKSLEATGGWINEAVEVPPEALDMMLLSVGRYPPVARGGPSWSGIIMDTNPPDEDHWWYTMFEVVQPKGYEMFKYEPAMFLENDMTLRPNPAADYVSYQPLGYDYWNRAAEGKDRQWILAMICGQYATTSEGKPVYPEYRDNYHYAGKDLEVFHGIPLITGWDLMVTALQPAVVFLQITPRGQMRILDELVGTNMGIRQFASEVVIPHISHNYSGMPIQGCGDPAGSTRSGTNEQTCYDVLKELGFRIGSARTNSFVARREAVVRFLLRTVDGLPGFQLSSKCKILRRGFNGKYMYPRLQVMGDRAYREDPLKNIYSHPHDALQYACMSLEPQVVPVTFSRSHKRHEVVVEDAAGWAR